MEPVLDAYQTVLIAMITGSSVVYSRRTGRPFVALTI